MFPRHLQPGSSPRLRGTRCSRCSRQSTRRFIPAPAGNTPAWRAAFPGRPVHPRACGEHRHTAVTRLAEAGSSPRLRGTRNTGKVRSRLHRFIPAPAGNTTVWPRSANRRSVHPRACGEHYRGHVPTLCATGSAPRLRGTRGADGCALFLVRFIPAPAGNTRPCRARRPRAPVHPRACGEHVEHTGAAEHLSGSSPRLRGTRLGRGFNVGDDRFIPAPAGNTRLQRGRCSRRSVHPRACGEHDPVDDGGNEVRGSSPRLRGTRFWQNGTPTNARFIPAPAGNTTSRELSDSCQTVHPRACGEHTCQRVRPIVIDGSSPRLRGTPQWA